MGLPPLSANDQYMVFLRQYNGRVKKFHSLSFQNRLVLIPLRGVFFVAIKPCLIEYDTNNVLSLIVNIQAYFISHNQWTKGHFSKM